MDILSTIGGFFTNTNLQLYLLAYLIGSIPFGLILAKVFAKVNIKEHGSHSIGATNVLRVVKETNPSLAKKLGLATVILDALKGAILVLACQYLGFDASVLWAIALFVTLGHCYSLYLNFEGGKGVATALGVFIVLIPLATALAALVWFVCAKVLKISSLSSLLALVSILISINFLYDGLGVNSNIPVYLIAFIIVYKHIPNIIRLINKEEKRVI